MDNDGVNECCGGHGFNSGDMAFTVQVEARAWEGRLIDDDYYRPETLYVNINE